MLSRNLLMCGLVFSLLAACASKPTETTASDKPAAAETTTKPATQTAAKPAPAPAKATEATPANVKKVTSKDGVEGEIEGTISPKSKFAKIQIGMSQKQVMDLIGQPTDMHGYVTGKAFIPFFYGGDTHRMEALYKGEGRLIFSPESRFSGSLRLIRITVNPKETGYD